MFDKLLREQVILPSPFRGMRPRITQILQKFGLLGLNERVDDRIHEDERDFAFGSILRCSISKWDYGKQDWAKSGDVISSLSKDWRAQRFLSNCVEQFLKQLPPRLRLVILLSNDDSYTRMCRTIIQKIHSDVRWINDVAYGNSQVTWVHVSHASGLNGHFPKWLKEGNDIQGRKARLAREAVEKSGAVEETRSQRANA
jgi:hypothetical protein